MLRAASGIGAVVSRAEFQVSKDGRDDNALPVTISGNTRLFDGIPALRRYGLVLLAVLKLGIGFVACLRFA